MVTYDHDLSKNRGKFQKQGWKLILNNCCLKITTLYEPSYEKGCPSLINTSNLRDNNYRIYSIMRPGYLLKFCTLRMGAYARWARIQFSYPQGALDRINTAIKVHRKHLQ